MMRTRPVLALLILAPLLAACGIAPPDILLSPGQADLGEIPNGEIRRIQIEVRNIGEAPLRIIEVITTCGCTTANVEPSVIPSGASAILTIVFDSGAHGPEFVGSVQRQVVLVTNDPDEEEVTFRFWANVRVSDP